MAQYQNNRVSQNARAHFGDNHYVVGASIEDEFRRLLYTAYPQRKTRHPPRYHETCGWFLNNVQFQHWRATPTSPPMPRILWVSAPAGFGKSVIAKTIADDVSLLPRTTKCHFFFTADYGDDTDLEIDTKVVGALLHQLLAATEQNELIQKYALPLYRKQHESLKHSLDELWGIFCMIAAKWQKDPIVCVLDGLDDCEKEARKHLLNRIFLLASTMTKLNIKFLLTSRATLEIERKLRKYNLNPESVRLDGVQQAALIGKEINYMIERRVPEILSGFHNPPSEGTRRRIVDHLKAGHCQTYLWLRYILNQLQELEPTSFLIDTVLTAIPTDLAKEYDRMWAKVCALNSTYKRYADCLFVTIMGVSQPLDLLHLKKVFSAMRGGSFETMSTTDFERLVQLVGGDLVIVADEMVRPVHYTAREFMSRLPINQTSKQIRC